MIFLYTLSFCGTWNDEIVEQLSRRFSLDRTNLDYNRSFVNRQDDCITFSMHSLMRECLKKQSMQIKPEIIHEVMFEFYQGKLKNIENRYLDENDEKALNEACYHGFFEEENIIGFATFIEWFIPVAIVFKNAGRWQILIDIYNKIF
jgi:hypothetical protein